MKCHVCVLQLATKLKVGVMWDHNGTYMEGLGFHYRSHKVVVELNPANPDTMAGRLIFLLSNTFSPTSGVESVCRH